MAGYTYSTYKTALQTLVVSQSPDTSFDAILPTCIDVAEQRIYRDLNLISTVETDSTTTLATASRSVSIPTTFVVVNNVAIITPAGTAAVDGERVPLIPVTRDVMDTLFPGNTTVGRPQMFCMDDQWSIIVGPSPDAGYVLEVVGTQRPAALAVANPTTFISERLPDLFIAASMVFMSGYMRNFGAQVSEPAQGMSWEQVYQSAKASADSEELRKHFTASSWSSQPVSSQAQPQRG